MKHAKAKQVEKPRRIEAEVRRTRALGDYDKTARESQRRAAAYGLERVERIGRFDVGGTWPTLPEFRLIAEQSSRILVYQAAIGKTITIDYEFAGGENVVIDCATESVSINDADARDCIALGSDFFSLEPGDRLVGMVGASCYEIRFVERWA